MGVGELSTVSRLGEEAVANRRGQIRLEHLDGHVALKHRVIGLVDGAHATFSEPVDDPVLLAVKQSRGGVERPAPRDDVRRGSEGLRDPGGRLLCDLHSRDHPAHSPRVTAKNRRSAGGWRWV